MSVARIKPLSLQLANQIAAGEVVERPASVVKELLENAIDAGATFINIEIERGGSSLIRISDNGQGIIKQDLSLAVTRHATSKLHTLKELEQMHCLGFRGEALASISAVSRLSIKSKTVEDERAWLIDTGTDSDFANYFAEPEPVSHPQGTTIEVRDLFFNTPARRKFLRTAKTEFRHIDEVVKRIALSRFNIGFKLLHNSKLIRHLPKAASPKAILQRISKLSSSEFVQYAQRVEFMVKDFIHNEPVRLWGWVAGPELERKQADWQFFYVNGRYIRDKLVNHALRQVYQHLLSNENYPAFLLYLEMDPAQIDVNVHPAKHEVRFRQTRLVHDFIYSALNQAVSLNEQSLNLDSTQHEMAEEVSQQASMSSKSGHLYPNDEVSKHQARCRTDTPKQKSNLASTGIAEGDNDSHRYARRLNDSSLGNHPINNGQVNAQLQGLKSLYQHQSEPQQQAQQSLFGKYLSCIDGQYVLTQLEEQLFVIDINRAIERIFEANFKPGKKKNILIPQSVFLKPSKLEQLLANQSLLSEWAMDISQISQDTVLLRSVPAVPFLPECEFDLKRFIECWQAVMPASKIEAAEQDSYLLQFKNCLKSALIMSSMTSDSLDNVKLLLEKVILTERRSNSEASNDNMAWAVLDVKQLNSLFSK